VTRTGSALADAARGRSAVFVSFVLLVALGAALFAVVVTLQGRRESAERRDVAMARNEAQALPPPSASIAPEQRSSAAGAGVAPRAELAPAGSSVAAARPDASAPPAPSSPAPVVPAPAAPRPAAVPATPPDTPTASAGSVVTDAVSVPYRLVAKTHALTWMRVRTEGGKATEENVPAGEVREWVSNRPFFVTVGNAGGVSFELNGRPLPPFGADGAVVREVIVPGPR
jgi:cytoskeletal protein RodZ